MVQQRRGGVEARAWRAPITNHATATTAITASAYLIAGVSPEASPFASAPVISVAGRDAATAARSSRLRADQDTTSRADLEMPRRRVSVSKDVDPDRT